MLNTTVIVVMALVMIGVGVGFLYMILSDGTRPQGALEWAGAALSGLLVFCAASLLLLSFSVRTGVGVSKGVAAQSEGKEAQNFTFRLVSDNAKRALRDYDDKVVLLNFWATWCAPCREEMPDLSKLQETYKSKGLRVVTISDETRQTIKAFKHKTPLKTTSGYLPHPEKLPEPFDQMRQGRPVSFLIDREGQIQGQYIGARSLQFFEQAITPYL